MHLVIAYIDPGSGSLLIQAALAALLSIPFIFRSSMRRALGRFRSRKAERGIDKPTDHSE